MTRIGRTLAPALTSAVMTMTAVSTHAAFEAPTSTPTGAAAFTHWTRGSADATYQQWLGPANGGTPALNSDGENFTTLFGLNQPDDDYTNPNGIPTAQFLDAARNSSGVTAGILIGGSGNIYSFSASADFEILVPDYGYGANAATTVIVQVQSSGGELLVGSDTPGNPTAPNTVKVDGQDWVDHVELSRVSSGSGFGGDAVEHWFRFELPDNPAFHTVEFDTYDSALGTYDDTLYGHTSTIGIAVDTYAQPAAISGDLNGDGYVGLDDLQPILDHWNQAVTVGDASKGDIAGPGGSVPDGYVGLDDLQPVLDHWNTGTLPQPSTTIPEPGALVLLGMAATGLLGRRRRA